MQTRNDSLFLLALCPLLGASQSIAAAIGLGFVMLVVVAVTELLRLASMPLTAPALQPATAILLWAATVTAGDLALQTWWPALHRDFGLFLPLLLPTGLLFFAFARGPHPAWHHVGLGAIFLGAAVLLGAARELTGQGSFFATSPLLLEPFPIPSLAGLSLFEENRAFLIAIMPPGAFIAAGLLLAARNALWPPAVTGPAE